MINNIKEFFEDILNELRNISYNNSEERREFAIRRLSAYRDYMSGHARWNPYIDEDEWNKQN